MVNGKKRSRGPNWEHEETVVLAELIKEAFLDKNEGGLVWEQISQRISSRFPVRKRTGNQCRRRWETLTKVFNHIEEYCMETGQDHSELDEEELSSMKLDTAYRQDWYNIVKEVRSQRKRNEESGYTDSIAVKRSKRSDTCVSPSTVLPDPPPERDNLYVTPSFSISDQPVITPLDADHEQLTPVNGQTSTQTSLEVEKLNPEKENHRLKRKIDALVLELAQFRQGNQQNQGSCMSCLHCSVGKRAEQGLEDIGRPLEYYDSTFGTWDDSTFGTWDDSTFGTWDEPTIGIWIKEMRLWGCRLCDLHSVAVWVWVNLGELEQ